MGCLTECVNDVVVQDESADSAESAQRRALALGQEQEGRATSSSHVLYAPLDGELQGKGRQLAATGIANAAWQSDGEQVLPPTDGGAATGNTGIVPLALRKPSESVGAAY